MYYKLDEDGNPVPESDALNWSQWFETTERHIADETIEQSRISTVFLGLNHNFGGGDPVLWETMVFGGPLDGEQVRCSGSREQAEMMHKEMVSRVMASAN